MFSVDFPLSRLFRPASRLASIALALSLTVGFSGVSTLEADASGKRWHKSGGHYSVKTRHSGSRHTSRRRAGRHHGQYNYRGHQRRIGRLKYRSHRRQYESYHRNNYARSHLFVGRSLRDVRSSGVSLGRLNYRVSTRNYGRAGLVITNQNGVRVISNYGRSYGDQYNPAPTINGVSINDECPLNFQCGLRAYDDNSGPRVITLGKGARVTVNDPAIEKIGPPKVITYSNRIN